MRGADVDLTEDLKCRVPGTPACAGLTPYGRRARQLGPLYPRVRGADWKNPLAIFKTGPLPPRARG